MDGVLRVILLDVKNNDHKSPSTRFTSFVLFCALEGFSEVHIAVDQVEDGSSTPQMSPVNHAFQE